MKGNSRGFTLTEILIVVAVLLLVLMVLLVNMQTQIQKAHDARRKTDLAKIQKAFEETFNDTQCYPGEEILRDCGGSGLSPYLSKIPCDPNSKAPYLYVPGAPTLCTGYRICARLSNNKDPDITRIGCSETTGCGWAPGFNYCLTSGQEAMMTADNQDTAGNIILPGNTPTPTPTPGFGGNYACAPGGACNNYANPISAGCPQSFASDTCNNLCSNEWFWCQN